jgi:hypothetical protein
VSATKFVLLIALLFCSRNALAQSGDKEPTAIIEVGGAIAVNAKDATPSAGPTLAVEVTPIENWLELEGGMTPLFSGHSTEWDIDLLFKKPWTLSDKVEFMAGAGPEWIHTSEQGKTTDSPGAQVALDFMF